MSRVASLRKVFPCDGAAGDKRGGAPGPHKCPAETRVSSTAEPAELSRQGIFRKPGALDRISGYCGTGATSPGAGAGARSVLEQAFRSLDGERDRRFTAGCRIAAA